MKKLLFSTICIVMGLISLNAQRMYVDADATGNNDGTSWANAFTNLDTALYYWDVVTWSQEIWVAEGTYTPGDGVDRTKAFLAKTAMYGGFDGTETSLADRDIRANPTILSGDLLGNDNGIVSSTEATRSDNSYSVIYSNYGSTIDGFFIEGGQANASSGSDQYQSGAAIYYYNNGGHIKNCIIRNNYGREDGAIVKFRGPTNTNSWFRLYKNEFYNNVSYRSQISSTRPSILTNWCYMYIYNNLFHHNEVEASNASIVCATNHVNGGSLSMGDYEYLIYHNTFVNNTIPSTGGTIGHGRNDINGNNNGWGDLKIEVVGNIIWDDAPTLVGYSIVSGSIDNSTQFYFMSNVIKGTDTIQTADLKSDQPYILGNVYNESPMFEDTANNDYRILVCAAPGNDIVTYTNSNLTINNDFYGHLRTIGFVADAGHCEVQQESDPVSIQQVGTTLVATAGFAEYSWYLGQQPFTDQNESTNILTPANGDGPYIVLVVDADKCKNAASINYCSSNTVSIALEGDSLVATGVGSGNTYQWYFGNVNIGTGPTYKPTSPGTYSVSFYEFDGMGVVGCSGSATFEITCDVMPTALISQNGNVLEVNADFDTYQWLLDGNAIAGATTSSFSPTVDGNYQVSVTGNFGCMQNSATFGYCSSVSVSISENNGTLEATTGYVSYQWFLVGGSGTGITGANASNYTPTTDGTYYCVASDGNCNGNSNTIVFSTTGINKVDFNSNEVKVYPNPTKSIINVDLDKEIESLEIFNLNGQLLKVSEYSNNINVSELQTGIYLLKIIAKDKSIIKKIIKN